MFYVDCMYACLFHFDFWCLHSYIDLFDTNNFPDYRQTEGGNAAKGWAVFGVLACMYDFLKFFPSLICIQHIYVGLRSLIVHVLYYWYHLLPRSWNVYIYGVLSTEYWLFIHNDRCLWSNSSTWLYDVMLPGSNNVLFSLLFVVCFDLINFNWLTRIRFIVISTLFCCGGFVYKTRVQNQVYIASFLCCQLIVVIVLSTDSNKLHHMQRGIDALPGMTLLSACLETVSKQHCCHWWLS